MNKPPDPLASRPSPFSVTSSQSPCFLLGSISKPVPCFDRSPPRRPSCFVPYARFLVFEPPCHGCRSYPINGLPIDRIIANLVSEGLDLVLISLASPPILCQYPLWVRFLWSGVQGWSNTPLPGFVFEVWVLKGEMRWATTPTSADARTFAVLLCGAAFVSPGDSAINRSLLMLLALFPGVIHPCSFIMFKHVLMFALCNDPLHAICGFSYLFLVHLFKWICAFFSLHPHHPARYLLCNPMSSPSPRSPLSISSDSHDSSTDLQNPLPAPNSHAQSTIPPLLDGVRPNHHASPSEPSRATFASTLKLGLGSHGSSKQSIPEPEPRFQHGLSTPSRGRFNRDNIEP